MYMEQSLCDKECENRKVLRRFQKTMLLLLLLLLLHKEFIHRQYKFCSKWRRVHWARSGLNPPICVLYYASGVKHHSKEEEQEEPKSLPPDAFPVLKIIMPKLLLLPGFRPGPPLGELIALPRPRSRNRGVFA